MPLTRLGEIAGRVIGGAMEEWGALVMWAGLAAIIGWLCGLFWTLVCTIFIEPSWSHKAWWAYSEEHGHPPPSPQPNPKAWIIAGILTFAPVIGLRILVVYSLAVWAGIVSALVAFTVFASLNARDLRERR